MECSVCGTPIEVRVGDYEFSESGLPGVVLSGIEMLTCPNCGNTDPVIPRLAVLMRSIATAVARKEYKLTGAEVRFLRKHLKMTAEKLGTLLGVDKTTVSKWENDADPVGDQSERLLRTLVLAPTDQEAIVDRQLIIKTLSAIGKERREAKYISDQAGELHREYQPIA